MRAQPNNEITKFLLDLTGLGEANPCTHIEVSLIANNLTCRCVVCDKTVVRYEPTPVRIQVTRIWPFYLFKRKVGA